MNRITSMLAALVVAGSPTLAAEVTSGSSMLTGSPAELAGGLFFTGLIDGSFAAYDDMSLKQLWEVKVGTGFNAPPMTFEAGGKQYVAILTGLGRVAKSTLVNTPELREIRNQRCSLFSDCESEPATLALGAAYCAEIKSGERSIRW